MSITVVTHTAAHRERVEGTVDEYRTVPGTLVQADASGATPTMLEGMLDAQADFGQVRWTQLSPTMAYGLADDRDHGGSHRVVVIDTDNADGADIVSAMIWVHGAH